LSGSRAIFSEKKRLPAEKRFYLIFMPRGNPASSGKNTKPKDSKMSKRMFRKPVKATRKNSAAATMSPAMQAAMFKVANVAANMSRKDEATQQAARKAIADTIEDWIGFLAENEPEAVEDFYYEVCMLATAGNRRRIAKHTPMPEGVFERVEDDLREQKEEAKREASMPQNADDDAKELISE
jgi:hypothetical protein